MFYWFGTKKKTLFSTISQIMHEIKKYEWSDERNHAVSIKMAALMTKIMRHYRRYSTLASDKIIIKLDDVWEWSSRLSLFSRRRTWQWVILRLKVLFVHRQTIKLTILNNENQYHITHLLCYDQNTNSEKKFCNLIIFI